MVVVVLLHDAKMLLILIVFKNDNSAFVHAFYTQSNVTTTLLLKCYNFMVVKYSVEGRISESLTFFLVCRLKYFINY